MPLLLDRSGELHDLASGSGIGDFLTCGLTDIATWINNDNTIGEVNLAQVEITKHRFKFLSEDHRTDVDWSHNNDSSQS